LRWKRLGTLVSATVTSHEHGPGVLTSLTHPNG
jgi:hypothetical protein